MRIRVNRKDSIWSLIGTAVSMGSNLIILPFLLYYLDDDSVGLYYVFISLYAITSLMDFGFNPSFARSMAYAWSGTSNLQRSGASKSNSSEPNWILIKKIIVSCRIIYAVLAGFTLLLGLTIGNVYISYISKGFSGSYHIIAWNIFAFAMFLTLFYGYFSAFLRGVGAISKVNISITIARIAQILLCIIFMHLRLGLIGVSLAYLAYGIIFRFIARHFFFNYENIGVKLKEVSANITFEEIKSTIRTLWPNSWREGVITLSNYLLNQATVLIASLYLSLTETGIYSLSVQLVSAVTTIAGTLYTAYQPSLQSNYANRDVVKQRENVAIIVSSFSYLYVVGILLLVTVATPLIRMIKPTYSLHIVPLLLLSLYHYILRYRDCFCSYYASTNRLIYTKAFIVSAIICVLLSLISTAVFDMGMYGLIASQIISQLIYNAWYWSITVHKELSLTTKFIFLSGPKYAIRDFMHNK